ncbi:MAG: hypothetical protein JWP94_1627 [Mucilaginibacter sp.]|nr:hypothetical protein [Mucilaginibacter sp.]
MDFIQFLTNLDQDSEFYHNNHPKKAHEPEMLLLNKNKIAKKQIWLLKLFKIFKLIVNNTKIDQIFPSILPIS